MSQFYQVSDWASSLRPAHRDPTDDTYVKRCHKERESKQNCNDTRKRGEWVDVKLELLTVFAKPSSLEPKFAHWQIRIEWVVGQTLSIYILKNVRRLCKSAMVAFAAARSEGMVADWQPSMFAWACWCGLIATKRYIG